VRPAGRARTLFPLLFFLGWALLFSFPLGFHIADSVALTRGGDAWLHIWDLWWLNKSLVDLHQNPYYTNYILFPTGLNLYYHSLDLFNGLLSIPLQHLTGLTATFNLLVLANLTIDGLASYLLCMDRTGSVGAALVGGAIFASAPLLGTSLDLGQLDEVTVWWVPLYIMALWRALDSPGPVWRAGGGRRATLTAAACLVGASLATWYFTAGLVVFTAVFVPAYLLARQRTATGNHDAAGRPSTSAFWTRSLVKAVTIAALFALALSPLLVAMVRERLSGATYMLSTLAATQFNSADLLGLFLPPRIDSDVTLHGSGVPLGYIALGLSIIGLVSYRRKLWPAGLGLVILVVMALGPDLQVAGNLTGIPLPYALLNNVPFIGASRQPLRFLATADACLALLAAFGVARLLGADRLSNIRKVLVPGALALLALEVIAIPRTLASTDTGPAYTFLKQAPDMGAVLELPNDSWSAPSLLDQTTHERPIIGGYTSRHFPYPFGEAAPGVAQLFGADPDPLVSPDILDPPVTATALTGLDHYNVRFVVVHKRDLATGRYGRLEQVLQTLFTAKDRVYEDAEVIIYRSPNLRPQPNTPGAVLPLVGLGSGWHKAEQNPVHRWTGGNVTNGDALVWIGVPLGEGGWGSYFLSLINAYSYKSPRHLSIVLDGKVLQTKEVGTAFQDIQVDLGPLKAGDHILTLKVAEPPESPPGDTRKLAIGVTNLSIQHASP
jgi:hypothetical protein